MDRLLAGVLDLLEAGDRHVAGELLVVELGGGEGLGRRDVERLGAGVPHHRGVLGVFQLLDDGPASRHAFVAFAVDLPQERVVVRDIVRDRAGVTLQRRGHNIGEG
jgi:hypothetical protein